jgi:hypothetical protein
MVRFLAPALALAALAAAALQLAVSARGGAQEDPRAEAAAIEAQLQRIETRVLRGDAELRRLNRALGAEVLAAMEAVRPGVVRDVRRLAALRGGGGGDGAPDEVRRLEAAVEAARREALLRPRLASMADAFHALLRERMIAADPGAEHLFQRYAELHAAAAGPP